MCKLKHQRIACCVALIESQAHSPIATNSFPSLFSVEPPHIARKFFRVQREASHGRRVDGRHRTGSKAAAAQRYVGCDAIVDPNGYDVEKRLQGSAAVVPLSPRIASPTQD